MVEPSPQELNTLLPLYTEGRYAEAAVLAQTVTERFPLHGFGWKALGAVLKRLAPIFHLPVTSKPALRGMWQTWCDKQ